MQGFWRKGLQAVGATGVRAICSLAVQKMVALWFGPVGITLLSHLQNLTALLISIPNDGINRGLTALLPSTLLSDGGTEQTARRNIKLAGLIWHSSIFALSILMVCWFPSSFVRVFSRGIPTATWLALFIPSIAGYFAFSYWCGLRLAEGKVQLYSYIQALTAVVALAIAGFGIIQGKVEIALLYILIGQGLGGLIAWVHTLKLSTKSGPATNGKAIWTYVKSIGRFGLMATGVALFGRLTEYFVRLMAMDTFRDLDIGYWQAVVRMSDAYMLPLNTFLTAVIFPVLAITGGRGPVAWQALRKGILMAVPIGWVALAISWYLRQDIMVWFNDIEFVAAAPLVGWQTIGDAFRIPSYFFATMILAQNKPMRFLALEFLSTAVYLVALYLLLPQYQVTGFVMAHALRYAVYLPASIGVAAVGGKE